jgi:hypothetical protein
MRLLTHPLFPIGRLTATTAAVATVSTAEMEFALNRHIVGDWGEVDEEDRQANDEALLGGLRLLSSYTNDDGTTFWIITEADRSVTTILLPSDY